MPKQPISEGLKIFIKQNIQTVLRLEVLLLLHHQQPRSFTAAEVANELGFEKQEAQDQLTVLEAIGVVVESTLDKPKFSYHPVNAQLGALVEQLAVGYSEQRVPILSMLLANQAERPRLFAEAFRIIRKHD
jgi:predicted transcriptional regulator